MYNPWTIIKSIVDKDSWFEIGALWGRTVIGGVARLGGRPVGIVSLNCEVNSGALDAAGSQKLTRLLKFCDVMNLPVVQFVDVRKCFFFIPFVQNFFFFWCLSSPFRALHYPGNMYQKFVVW